MKLCCRYCCQHVMLRFHSLELIIYVMVTGVYVDSPTDFIVDSRAIARRDDGKVTCTITNPSGTKTENLITPLADGTYRISYTPFEEGKCVFLYREISLGVGLHSQKTVCSIQCRVY